MPEKRKARGRAEVRAAVPRQPGSPPKAPTTEIGVPAPVTNVGIGGPLSWGTYMDDREYADDLRWQPGGGGSVGIYQQMEGGDAQMKGLLLATFLPVRRLLWQVDPNGAEPKVVDHVAEGFSLPVLGGDPTAPDEFGFNHDRHLAHALRAIVYGHYYFERVYEYRNPRDGGDGLMHLKKLGTRPPRTIIDFIIADNGELQGIRQNVGVLPGRGPLGALIGGRTIDANSLLAYVWDSEDDGDWIGRSMLRPAYKNWLLKDRLIRVDATMHERNGMGIPHYRTDKDATQDQVNELAAIAQGVRAGTRGGSAGPATLEIKGVDGTLPKTVDSIRYHDQQMSRAFLSMWMDLGTTETGSRALGQTMLDFAIGIQDTIADWYVAATQAQIEDDVLVNFGTDVQMPKLVWTRVESEQLAFADLALGVEKGLIEVDDEFRAMIAQRWKIAGQRPEEIEAAREAEPQPAPAAPPPPTEPPPTTTAAPEAPRPKRSAMAERLLASCNHAMTWPQLAAAAGTDRRNGTARRARDQLVAEGALTRGANGRLAPLAGLRLPERELRRNPQPFEVEAAVDFEAMEATYVDAVDQLVAVVRAAQGEQVAEARAAVEAADGDPAALARITVEPVPTSVIEPILQEVARAGLASAKAEHDAQIAGKPAARMAEPDTEALEATVRERAEAASLTLAAGLSASAAKKAAAVSALPPADAAAAVGTFLDDLSDAALTEQLGGATQQAYNSGRTTYMAAADPAEIYASELLDGNTCSACMAIDGEEWETLAEAQMAYPVGGYVECQGGLRCRGTLVAVYV